MIRRTEEIAIVGIDEGFEELFEELNGLKNCTVVERRSG